MKNKKINLKEKGQSIILIAFVMAGVLGMMALAVDGGLIYNNRRKAQTAADAGALRGAREICANPSATEAEVELLAKDYTELYNNGTNSDIDADLAARTVLVKTYITTDTFIASLIGRSSAEISATARAGCSFPSEVTNVAPIAWSCYTPPVTSDSDSGDCDDLDWIEENEYGDKSDLPWEAQLIYMQQWGAYFTWEDYENDTTGTSNKIPSVIPDNLYVVMDDDDFEPNPDESASIIGGGNRGWVDLDGGQGGAADLKAFINGTKTDPVSIHTWAPLKTGTVTTLFSAVEAKIGEIIYIPAYDYVCAGNPVGACDTAAHESGDPDGDELYKYIQGNNPNQNYVHIMGFAPFFVTCVKSGGNDDCPGTLYIDEEIGGININSVKTIEGFFILTNINSGTGGGGADLGVYTVTLLPYP